MAANKFLRKSDVRNIHIPLQTISTCIRIRLGQKILYKSLFSLKSKMAAKMAASEANEVKFRWKLH